MHSKASIPLHTDKDLTPEILISHHYVAVYAYKRKGCKIPNALAEEGKRVRVRGGGGAYLGPRPEARI